jgi:hypothetical protein
MEKDCLSFGLSGGKFGLCRSLRQVSKKVDEKGRGKKNRRAFVVGL